MQGSGLLAQSIELPGVECVAACDLYDGRHTLAREITNKPDLPVTRRYQELLANKDIDCIVAAVPDHWHKQVVVDAVTAGKDIYCEKPMSHSPADGVAMVDAAKRTGKIVQIGSQRVSSLICKKAKDMVAEGVLGELMLVEGWLGRNDPTGAWVYPPPFDLSPQNLDWDTWQGTVPKRPFDPNVFARGIRVPSLLADTRVIEPAPEPMVPEAAAEAMAKRLRDAGFPESDVQVLGPNDRKKNMVARLRGESAELQQPLPFELVTRGVGAGEAGRADVVRAHRRRAVEHDDQILALDRPESCPHGFPIPAKEGIFVFLLLIGGAAVGFVRGFVHEVISLFAWVVAIAMLKLFHSQLWTGIDNSFHTSPAAGAVLAFAILFIPSFLEGNATGLLLLQHGPFGIEALRPHRHDGDRDDDPDHRVADRHPVRVLERIGRRHLDELVPEREEEQHDPPDRQRDMQQQVQMAQMERMQQMQAEQIRMMSNIAASA